MKKTATAALVVFVLYLVLESNLIPWSPSYRWHIEGRVFDKPTNVLAGVTVVATGKVRWTLINLYFGTAAKPLRVQTITDEAGRFSLAFEAASSVKLTLNKDGYAENSRTFSHSSGASGPAWSPTDQHLQIFLNREGEAQKLEKPNAEE